MKHVHDLSVSYRNLSEIHPNNRNARSHTRKQIDQIASSIRELGFTNPILVDEDQTLIAGHGRLAAAKELAMAFVPTIQIFGLTDPEKRALMLADNKIAENAGWDIELLKVELQSLTALDIDFPVEITGFRTAEIDILLNPTDAQSPDEADVVPLIDRTKPSVSRPGDIWNIGRHVLICGNALERDTYCRLLGAEKAQLIFTDPPYNVPIEGHVSGKGRIKHQEFEMAFGEMSRADFTDFLYRTFELLVANSKNGSIHFICMDWRHMQEILAAADNTYAELKNVCVWAKTNGGMGSLYRSQHELVFVFKNGFAPHINNVELGRFGRNRTNLWTYAGANTFGRDRTSELAAHPTVKPLALVSDAILDCSSRNGLVLDPFAGSGTTLIAAERTARRGRGIEIDPYYVDTIVTRFKEVCGLEAFHAETAQSYEDLRSNRVVRPAHVT